MFKSTSQGATDRNRSKDAMLVGAALRTLRKELHPALQLPITIKKQTPKISYDFSTSQYLKFDFGQITQPELLMLQGLLLCIAPPAKHRKIAALTKHCKDWSIKNKLLSAKDPLLMGIVDNSTNALRQADTDKLKLYSDYVTLLLTLNTLLADNWQKIGAVKDLQKMLKILFAHLKGLTQKDYIKASKITLPKFKILCDAFFDIGTRLRAQNIELKYFINSVELYFNSLVKEFTVRFNHATLSLEEQLILRAIVGGLDTACELAYALLNIQLAPIVRENGYFKQLQQHAYMAAVMAHDILTLGKQIKKKQPGNNYILLKHDMTKNSLHALFSECQYHYNTEVSRFASKTQSLLNTIPASDYAATMAALITLADHVQARIDWALQTARYQEKMAKVKLITKI